MEPVAFDDPALKRAIRRVCGGETAPAELRQHIVDVLRESALETAPLPITRSIGSNGHSWGMRHALAAAVAVGVMGLAAVLVFRKGEAALVSPTLAQALVARHDGCCGLPVHRLPKIPQGDYSQMAAAFTQDLGHRVMARAPGDQWQLRGAAICPVLNDRSAHLVFDRGVETLSLLSLPASIAPSLRPHSKFSFSRSDHTLAGFTEGDGFFCLVEFHPGRAVTAGEVQGLRDRLQEEIRVARLAHPDPLNEAALATIMSRVLQ